MVRERWKNHINPNLKSKFINNQKEDDKKKKIELFLLYEKNMVLNDLQLQNYYKEEMKIKLEIEEKY